MREKTSWVRRDIDDREEKILLRDDVRILMDAAVLGRGVEPVARRAPQTMPVAQGGADAAAETAAPRYAAPMPVVPTAEPVARMARAQEAVLGGTDAAAETAAIHRNAGSMPVAGDSAAAAAPAAGVVSVDERNSNAMTGQKHDEIGIALGDYVQQSEDAYQRGGTMTLDQRFRTQIAEMTEGLPVSVISSLLDRYKESLDEWRLATGYLPTRTNWINGHIIIVGILQDKYVNAALAALEAHPELGEIDPAQREEIAKAIGDAHGMPGGWRELTPAERTAFQRDPINYRIAIPGRAADKPAKPIETLTGRFIVTIGTSKQNGEKLGRLARAGLLPAQARFLADEGWVGRDNTPAEGAKTVGSAVDTATGHYDAAGKWVMPVISIGDAQKIAERIKGKGLEGHSFTVIPAAEGRAIIEISVPSLTGKEGFTAKGEVNLSDPAITKLFYDFGIALNDPESSGGGGIDHIMGALRKFGASLPKTVIVPAKKVLPADLIWKLSIYYGASDTSTSLVVGISDEASARKFLKELETAFTAIKKLERNGTIKFGDTYDKYRYDPSRTATELFALSLLFEKRGFPLGKDDRFITSAIDLIREYYVLKGILPPVSSDSAAGTPETGGIGTSGTGGTGQAGVAGSTGAKGGFDFANTQDKNELTVTAGGLKLSGSKATAYLAGGKLAGFRLAILALRY